MAAPVTSIAFVILHSHNNSGVSAPVQGQFQRM